MLNMGLSQRIVIDTQRREWFEGGNGGLWTLPLVDEDDHMGQRTSLIRCDPGTALTSRDLMGVMFTEEDLNQQQRVKCAFDPDGLLNPGKVFPTLHRCAELGL